MFEEKFDFQVVVVGFAKRKSVSDGRCALTMAVRTVLIQCEHGKTENTDIIRFTGNVFI